MFTQTLIWCSKVLYSILGIKLLLKPNEQYPWFLQQFYLGIPNATRIATYDIICFAYRV